MRELSVAEQRYQAALAVISDGETVTEVAARQMATMPPLHHGGWHFNGPSNRAARKPSHGLRDEHN
jgi:hypothetical protein